MVFNHHIFNNVCICYFFNILVLYMITSISPNLLLNFIPYDLLSSKSLNRECEVLLSQIEELRNNYQTMVMNKYKKEYTIINGQKLSHFTPYKSQRLYNVEKCKAVCSSDNKCYGFNKINDYASFNKPSVQCDFISKNNANNTDVMYTADPNYMLYINLSDENIKSTKKILDKLISDFFSKCNRNMDIIESFTGETELSTQNVEIYSLKELVKRQQKKMESIVNDIRFIEKEYSNSSIEISHNNVILSVYTIVVIILIIIAIKSIVTI